MGHLGLSSTEKGPKIFLHQITELHKLCSSFIILNYTFIISVPFMFYFLANYFTFRIVIFYPCGVIWAFYLGGGASIFFPSHLVYHNFRVRKHGQSAQKRAMLGFWCHALHRSTSRLVKTLKFQKLPCQGHVRHSSTSRLASPLTHIGTCLDSSQTHLNMSETCPEYVIQIMPEHV